MATPAATPRSTLAGEGGWLLVVGVALSSLATFPLLPVSGAQLSDLVAAFGALVVLVTAARAWLAGTAPSVSRSGALAMLAYGAAACLSFAVAGGSATRLLGYLWLVGFGLSIAIAGDDVVVALRLRRALVFAAVVGALTGVAGAVLFWFGKPTGLLNIAGDLVPGNYPRIRGTMLRANALAGLLATGLLLLGDVPRRWRGGVGAVLVAAFVFTFSRSWIALVGAAAVWLLALPSHRRRDAIAVLVVLATIAVMLAVSWLDIRLDPTRPWDMHIGSGTGTRWVHLNDALETIAHHPLGMGPGRPATIYGWDAHFSPANIAGIIGIPAALAFIVLLAIAIYRSISAARAGDPAARGLAAALVLFALDALARDVEDQRALWVLIGLALVRRVRREGAASAD